ARKTWMPATSAGITYSANAVPGEFLGDVRLNRFRGDNVEVAAGGIVVLDLGNAAAIERVCPFRLDPQRRVIVGNGRGQLPGLQVYQGAAVERVRIARLKLQGHIAIIKSRLKIADDGSRPAAVVEGLGAWSQPNHLVEVLDSEPVIATDRQHPATP